MKRTTLILEDAIFKAVRQLAAREGQRMSDVVNSLLGERLQRRSQRDEEPAFELPAFHMGRPRVNLGDRDALEASMES